MKVTPARLCLETFSSLTDVAARKVAFPSLFSHQRCSRLFALDATSPRCCGCLSQKRFNKLSLRQSFVLLSNRLLPRETNPSFYRAREIVVVCKAGKSAGR